MGRVAKRWHKRVAAHFDFVVDCGFDLANVKDGSFWSTWCSYRSPSAVIQITLSREFGRAEVSLIRLVADEVPPYPIWVTTEPLNHTLLDTVLEARQSALLDDPRSERGLDDASLDRQLAFWAEALREVAPDFLAGSCSAIDEAESVIRARVAQHPQKVVSWLPEDASLGDERASIEELRAQVSTEVGIEARRYRRRT